MIIMLSIISELFIDRLFMSIDAYFVLVLSIYFLNRIIVQKIGNLF